MTSKQVLTNEKDKLFTIKQILQEHKQFEQFFKDIVRLRSQDRIYYISGAQFTKKFSLFGLNSAKCLLVIQINQNEQAEIGYVKQVKINQFPLNPGLPHMQIKTHLKYLQNFQLITKDNQLLINFYDSINNKNEACQFKFKDNLLLNKWVEKIIDLNCKKQKTEVTKEEQIKKNNNEMKKQHNQLQQKLELVKKERQILNDMLKKEQQKIQILEAQDAEAKKQKAQLMLSLSQCKERLQESQREYKKKIEQQCKFILEKNQRISDLEQQLLQSNEQIEQLKSKLKITIDTLTHQKVLSAAKDSQSANAIIVRSQQIEKLQTLLAQQKQNQHQLKHINEEQIQSLKRQLLEKSNLIKILKQKNQILLLFPFFNGCLNQYQQEKMFLKESISKYSRKSIESTKKLFQFDAANKTGFHHYFDNRQNIVLIFKAATGMIVAAFSQSPLNERQASGNGAILSLTNQFMFPLLEGRKAVSYDEYYIIFGSSQINIRGGQLKVLSNFGCSSRCYDSKGFSSQILLGQKCQQIQLEWYQIHQINFVE